MEMDYNSVGDNTGLSSFV